MCILQIGKEDTGKCKSSTGVASTTCRKNILDLENATNASSIDVGLCNAKKRKRRRESYESLESIDIVANANLTGNLDESDLNSSDSDRRLIMHTSCMDYWLLVGSIAMLKKNQKQQLLEKFPISFAWLLETCANILGLDWSVIFEQLLVIELMFGIGLENVDIEKCIYLKYNNRIKDFNMLVNYSREIW